MSGLISKECIDRCCFNWKDLDGKTVVVKVNSSFDELTKEMVTIAMAFDDNGYAYVVHSESKRVNER